MVNEFQLAFGKFNRNFPSTGREGEPENQFYNASGFRSLKPLCILLQELDLSRSFDRDFLRCANPPNSRLGTLTLRDQIGR